VCSPSCKESRRRRIKSCLHASIDSRRIINTGDGNELTHLLHVYNIGNWRKLVASLFSRPCPQCVCTIQSSVSNVLSRLNFSFTSMTVSLLFYMKVDKCVKNLTKFCCCCLFSIILSLSQFHLTHLVNIKYPYKYSSQSLLKITVNNHALCPHTASENSDSIAATTNEVVHCVGRWTMMKLLS
jgi:hypothetical protein